MFIDVRMKWEPENLTPLSEIAERVSLYLQGRGGVSILGNGTLLFIKNGEDDSANAKQALEEAKFLSDFRVKQLNEGGYLVALHKAVAVFVGQREFETRKPEIIARFNELKFPSEELIVNPSTSNDELLVGVYGRGKLQRDVYNFSFYQRV
jgi:hypothetical protein